MLRDLLHFRPMKTWREYKKERGMSPWRDVVDWVGGYPYEYASIDEVVESLKSKGFRIRKAIPAKVPTGCNEFVFEKI